MTEQPAAAPRSRWSRWMLPLVLALGALATQPFLGHDDFDSKTDASMYVLCARSLAENGSYELNGEPFTMRPPGLSAALAPLIAAFGTDFRVLNLAMRLMAVAGVVALFLFARARLGELLAFLLATSLWLNADYQAFSSLIMSDVPGTALVLGCLALARTGDQEDKPSRAMLLGLAVGASAYMRMASLLVLPAVHGARLIRDLVAGLGLRRAGARLVMLGGLSTACTVVVLLPMLLRNGRIERRIPTDQTLSYSYATGMLHVDPGDPGSALIGADEVRLRLRTQVPAVLATLGRRLAERPRGERGSWDLVAGAFLLAVVLVDFLRRRRAPELFVLGSTLLLFFYFGFASRLVLTIYVLSLVVATETLSAALGRLGPRIARAVCATALIAVTLADVGPATERERIHQRSERLQLVCRTFEKHIPAGVPLGALQGRRYGVFLEDNPVYSLDFAADRDGLLGAVRVLDRYDIRYCILEATELDDQLRAALPLRVVARVGQTELVLVPKGRRRARLLEQRERRRGR